MLINGIPISILAENSMREQSVISFLRAALLCLWAYDIGLEPLGDPLPPSLQSIASEAGANPIFSGVDPLAALTDNLNQHIVAEAFKPRAPAPWELNAFAPSPTIPEEDSFTFTERDELPRRQSSRLPSQAIEGQHLCAIMHSGVLHSQRIVVPHLY